MRKLRLTPEEVEKTVAEFQKMLQRGSSVLGKMKFEFDVGKIEKPPEEKKAKVVFTPIAWVKMNELVKEFSSEVAWHFLAKRDEQDPMKFIMYDVIVYPQQVTGATVEMDEIEYGKWLMNLDDDILNHIRGQGHSHVNLGVFASTTDLDHQNKIVSLMTPESENPFYCFVIINKKGDIHFDLYDIENNIVYEDKDVRFFVYDQNNDIVAFIDDAKQIVCKPQPKKTNAVVAPTKVKKVDTPVKYLDEYDDDYWDDWKGSLYGNGNYLL